MTRPLLTLEEREVLECFLELGQSLNLPQILGWYERRTGNTPSQIGAILASLVAKGALLGPRGAMHTYTLTEVTSHMDQRALLKQRFDFLQALHNFGPRAAPDEIEVAQVLGWDRPTTQNVVQWLTDEELIKSYVSGEVTTTHAGRTWIETGSLNSARSVASGHQGVTQQFHGTVGAVITGDNATANVLQHVATDDQRVVVEALGMLERLVTTIQDAGGMDRKETVALIAQVREEASKPQPDRERLAALGAGLATAIQTVGSLQAAWSVVKVGLSALGVNLP
jgi:hypothetical protein